MRTTPAHHFVDDDGLVRPLVEDRKRKVVFPVSRIQYSNKGLEDRDCGVRGCADPNTFFSDLLLVKGTIPR
jgi:hypothetical protein